MHRSILALCVLYPLVSYADSNDWYGSEFRQCRQDNTTSIVDCVDAHTEAWDRRLNAAYRARMTREAPNRRSELRSVQRLWIRYRDANCGYYAHAEGSISRIETSECMRVMTRERALELEQGLQ